MVLNEEPDDFGNDPSKLANNNNHDSFARRRSLSQSSTRSEKVFALHRWTASIHVRTVQLSDKIRIHARLFYVNDIWSFRWELKGAGGNPVDIVLCVKFTGSPRQSRIWKGSNAADEENLHCHFIWLHVSMRGCLQSYKAHDSNEPCLLN